MRSFVELSIFSLLLVVFLYLGDKVQEKMSSPTPKRTIASIQTQIVSPPLPSITRDSLSRIQTPKKDIPTIQLTCDWDSQPLRTQVSKRFFRLTGKSCGSAFQIQVTHNDKVEAQVFWHKTSQKIKTFSTDLIRLQRGENRIHIATVQGKKTLKRELHVFNQP